MDRTLRTYTPMLRPHAGRALLLAPALLMLCACVTRSATLTDAQGEARTCQVTSRMGPLARYRADRRLESCIEQAKKEGFQERPQS